MNNKLASLQKLCRARAGRAFVMMRSLALYALFSLCLLGFNNAAFSQQNSNLNIRSGLHEEYTRIVFDWPSGGTNYEVVKASPTRSEILFNKAATNTDLSALELSESQHVSALDIIAQSPLRVGVSHVRNADLRVFSILNRIVVDVKADGVRNTIDKQADKKAVKPAKPVAQSSSPKVTPPKANTKKAGGPTDEQKNQLDALQEKEEQVHVGVDFDNDDMPVKAVNDAPPSLDNAKTVKSVENDHKASSEVAAEKASYFERIAAEKERSSQNKVVVSSTTALNMAAFIRGDHLWLVVDKPDYYVLPQIRGQNTKILGRFKRLDIQEGSAFYMSLPKDREIFATGEGGGLDWGVLLSETPRKLKSNWPVRDVDGHDLRGGGSMKWTLPKVSHILKFTDPFLGDTIHAAVVEQADSYSGVYKSYVDFTVLDSIIGMAYVPKSGNIEAQYDEEGISLSREGGLALMPPSDVLSFELRDNAHSTPQQDQSGEATKIVSRIFKFDQWRLGGRETLRQNQEVMMQGLYERNTQGRAQDLIGLAKLEISNARGAEAVGYLKLAGQEYRPFRESPEYLALLGAAYALNNQFDIAFRVLMVPQLDDFDEIKYWRAYALAELDDWVQAGDVLPSNARFLRSYPRELRLPLSIKLAEVFLRKGDVEHASQILKFIEEERDTLRPEHAAALAYLNGELKRQKSDIQGALDDWRSLTKHKDDFYRTRARLALSDLRYSLKEITIDKAIDDLERLRFAWRGDEIETTVSFKLGRLYFEKGSYIKGLSVLRQAVALSENTTMGGQMAAYMQAQYKDLFLGEKSNTLTPLQLVMIYEEFSELTPTGPDADRLLQSLAERLVDVDLLGRAIDILNDQVENRSTGVEQIKLALRLAGIQVINNANADALDTLKIAERAINKVPILDSVPYRREMNLLRARALSRDNRARDALLLLSNMKQDDDVIRLKADVAWTAGHWNDAAEALEELVSRYDIGPKEPINAQQANMILNWAVTLSLSGNRHVISNVRAAYGAEMKKTAKGDLFEVVTRPRQNAILADRDTIQQIVSEVDIFGDFLDVYRAPKGQ